MNLAAQFTNNHFFGFILNKIEKKKICYVKKRVCFPQKPRLGIRRKLHSAGCPLRRGVHSAGCLFGEMSLNPEAWKLFLSSDTKS